MIINSKKFKLSFIVQLFYSWFLETGDRGWRTFPLICGSASSVTVWLVVSLRLVLSFLVFLLLRDVSLDAAAELAKTSLLVVDLEVAAPLGLLLPSP